MRLAFETFTGSGWAAGTITIRDLLAALHTLGDARPIIEMVEWWDTNQEDYAAYRPFVDGALRPIFPGPRPVAKPTSQRLLAERPQSARKRLGHALDGVLGTPPLPPPPIRRDELMRHLGVDCVFSVTLEHRTDVSTALLVWVYDLQHHHLPDLLEPQEFARRNRIIETEASHATRLIVKSESVRADLAAFLPQYKDKIRVIHFVSDVPEYVYTTEPQTILKPYDLPERFIYLPNQFWQHKNHLRVIEALALLGESDIFPTVVCTGSIEDHRAPDYIRRVRQKIERARLQERFLILGTVPRDDVFALMRQALVVMNPSLFEGFGLSASEATSLGKRTLLSDLPCLREQNPPDALYFDPTNTVELAERIREVWTSAAPGPDLPREALARAALAGRQQTFAREFVEIAKEAVSTFREHAR